MVEWARQLSIAAMVKRSNHTRWFCYCASVKVFYGNFTCLVALLVAEMCWISSIGCYEVFKPKVLAILEEVNIECDSTRIRFACKMTSMYKNCAKTNVYIENWKWYGRVDFEVADKNSKMTLVVDLNIYCCKLS